MIVSTKIEYRFLKSYAPFSGRVLECGSAVEKCSAQVREITSGAVHIGTDMQASPTVDLLHNLNEPLAIEPVDTVICLSVLEHCDKPWLVGEHLVRVLKPGGLLLVSAPFAWRVHGYPNDYFRFTFEGIKLLFPGIAWDVETVGGGKQRLDVHPTSQTMILMSGIKQ